VSQTDIMRFEAILKPDELEVLDELWHSWAVRQETAPQKRIGTRPAGMITPKLGSRADAARNFRRTGGRFGRSAEPHWILQARTSYFRDEYVHGNVIAAPGAELVLGNPALADAARDLYGMRVIVPYIVYGNLLVPGQELGLHTDVPAFRGADRKEFPLWFLVVMRHSGLFEQWRIPVATAVAFVGECSGGEFAYYPDGPSLPARQIDPVSGSVVMFDADTIFHGVDRVMGDDSGVRSVNRGKKMRLLNRGDRRWALLTNISDPTAEESGSHFFYGSDELRFSASWKAYCFSDDGDREAWENHRDDLSKELIVETLVAELCERQALASEDHGLSDTELALLMIDTFIQFPEVTLSSVVAPGTSRRPSL
jgi:hypothetical protein